MTDFKSWAPSHEDWDNQCFIALEIAAVAHEGQLDKGGIPYLSHPVRVSQRVSGPQCVPAALLHDVIEDTEWGPQELLDAGIHPVTVTDVIMLSKKFEYPEETNREYHARLVATGSKVARKVKMADLKDNMDPRRPWHLPSGMRKKYEAFYIELRDSLAA